MIERGSELFSYIFFFSYKVYYSILLYKNYKMNQALAASAAALVAVGVILILLINDVIPQDAKNYWGYPAALVAIGAGLYRGKQAMDAGKSAGF